MSPPERFSRAGPDGHATEQRRTRTRVQWGNGKDVGKRTWRFNTSALSSPKRIARLMCCPSESESKCQSSVHQSCISALNGERRCDVDREDLVHIRREMAQLRQRQACVRLILQIYKAQLGNETEMNTSSFDGRIRIHQLNVENLCWRVVMSRMGIPRAPQM
jgi:hypothetical protein